MKAKLNQPESIKRVRSALRFGPVAVEFCAQATRFELVLVPCGAVADAEEEFRHHSDSLYVCIPNFHAGAMFPSSPSAGYVQEKLALKHYADAANVACFLTALVHRDGAESYLRRLRLDGDHLAEDGDTYVSAEAPRA